MKIFKFLLAASITFALIFFLNKPLTFGKITLPKLGMFFSPSKGFWANAESSTKSFDANIKVKNLKANANVFFDARLVPHIYAENTNDAYFLQGFLHAKFRLWQMEFQTHIAAGRLSEIRGKDSTALKTDKFFRRLGMVYAAENCLTFMEKDPATKSILDAYTAGVNAYIDNMKSGEIPLEYKLMSYEPEHWTNLKTALFLKLMSFDLTGQDDDIVYSNAKKYLGYNDYMKIFPNLQDSLDPILPKGTKFDKPSINVIEPKIKDSNYLLEGDALAFEKFTTYDADKGSNNWAVDSTKTKSKRPILCNDPHLGLNLPSLWYEMQITTPEYSAYGASFPGSPAIIIGFNNNIAWGVTNAGRDVKDYYELKFKDASLKEYWFDSSWKKSVIRNEIIKVKNDKDVVEKLAITDFGVVMYDKNYFTKNNDGKTIAVRWTAHDASNELQTFIKLNSAKNYTDYKKAISTFSCPGQNFVFASKTGDVAITQEGKFVAKWQQQGDFVMPGFDSSFMWQCFIPEIENPAQHNPSRGFVSSANQKAVDETYPYYLGRAANFPFYRGVTINKKLNELNNITVDDMMQMQTNSYDEFAVTARQLFLKYIDTNKLNENGKRYIDLLQDWNGTNVWDEKAATICKVWFEKLDSFIYADDFAKNKFPLAGRMPSALLKNLFHDSAYSFIDNINTPAKENITNAIQSSFNSALQYLLTKEKEGKLQWGKYRETNIMHLAKLDIFSRMHLTTNGGGNCINATKENNGPSWRMIVHLTDNVEAFGVYPGGQNGNCGSKFYDNFIDTWVAGKYNKLLFITKDKADNNDNFKWKMNFIKS